ncbi:MAG: class I SAM-dependent methyltransferase [Acidobacteriia bacterium]|nr:class I SAM-dependent methyltransferase [Terriglobia bacterium]
MHKLKLIAKDVFFPGLDLHTRCRYRVLKEFIRPGPIDTLDAGSGNGALSYLAYRKGNRVLGVTALAREVADTTALFRARGIPAKRVEFREMNIYDLRSLNRRFDQIICSETLEHIRRDREVVQMFADLLNPGGRLLLCCPHALHPEHNLGRTDEPETGYHVRDGYTFSSYEEILQPAGFTIMHKIGLGSPVVVWQDRGLRWLRHKVGDAGAFPAFLLLLPFGWLDYRDPKIPFSVAVVAEKR